MRKLIDNYQIKANHYLENFSDVSLKAAREGIILLKNDGVLPLKLPCSYRIC